ncbi:DUF2062 domain-containing protein [Rhizobium halophytocola]|uniref:Uncharacterized protein (DUF2062 family) n=1 Tax=Rhizobium halophytocola TaxID=735519 RepID=A0ABS4DYT0_9HYPH|nr:DUF2062 domain-containing protein [Rhizobium halophytocola]MBP1850835.1 uncharacterized protein (DUF2062 family) [Rhizobium halophytocola]
MLFRRRKPAGWKEKLSGLVWPRKGFIRPFQYFRMRILRLTASPHSIAAGVAAGVMASWTPFMGFHFILSFAIAFVLAGNMVAAALGTAFGNPLTFPFIWTATWQIGKRMLGEPPHAGRHINLRQLFEHADLSQIWNPVLKPMVIGAIPPALITGATVYIVLYFVVRGYQARRRVKLAARSRARLKAAITGPASV